jgi:hypothetical protein
VDEITPRQRAKITRRVRRAKNLVKLAPEFQARRRCKAMKTNGKEPCGLWAIKGGTVCVRHGGSSPQVKRAAALRLLSMVDPALVQLQELVIQNDHLPTKLGAIRTVLERAGDEAIGPLKTRPDAKDTRPIINIGIKVGGINTPKLLSNFEPQVSTDDEDAVVEAEIIEE